jgi:membrane-bound serine protease (ClpP class)
MRGTLRLLLIALILTVSPASADVLKIEIDGVIHPITEEFIERAIEEATLRRDAALLITLRTPGGLEESTRRIVTKITASKVPVLIYVTPSGSRAASAGFFILQAADVAAMAPGTNTGAAHPVLMTGGDKIDDVMKSKMRNDSAAFMRSIVAKRGRNVAAAESAVVDSKSFSEQEALGLRLIDYIARDERHLLALASSKPVRRFDGKSEQLSLASQPVRRFEMTLKQQILAFLMDPNIAFILFSLGVMALWAEFTNPGAILPGVVGLVAIVLAVFALNLLPTRFAALGLILAAFVLFALEAKFVSHGILGIGGAICMTIGALLLVDGPIPEMRVKLVTALAVSLPLAAIAVFLMSLAFKAYKSPTVTGEQGMIGEVGIARTPLAPTGQIFVHGELWNAVASSVLPEGARVRVTAVKGLTLEVERAEAAAVSAAG